MNPPPPLRVLRSFAALLIPGLFTFPSSVAAQPPPNIVLIFADDLGYADLACYGHPYAITPNLDRLASEGTAFTQHYVTGVTCNPSRTGLMTSRYPARFEKYTADHGFANRATVTSLLKERGYRTGHFGKWHIGPKATEVDGMYGIDTVRVLGGSSEDPEGRDARLFEAADTFIREHADQPFYVNIWGHSTHFPVRAAPELASKFIEVKVNRSDFSDTMQPKFDDCLKIGGDLDASMHQYLADVYSIDLNVGRILDTLDELGLRENTIVVFSSDHGPAPVIVPGIETRSFSNNMLGYAGTFRGGKHTQFEGGIRVPFIIRWPGQIPAGRIDRESVTSFLDWLPTLCSIAGVENLPGDLDGQDISDIWFGASRERGTPLFWRTSSTRANPAVRDGDWKLHLSVRGRTADELYNLATDPAESTNLAANEPETLARLTALTHSWLAELPETYAKTKPKRE